MPLFRQRGPRPPSELRAGSRGIVTCTAPHLASSTVKMAQAVRAAGCALPGEAWHVDELSPAQQALVGEVLTVRSLADELGDVLRNDRAEWVLLRGYACKPLAVAASAFEQVLLLDHDVTPYINLARLFETMQFIKTGTLLFRDRTQLRLFDFDKALRMQSSARALVARFGGNDEGAPTLLPPPVPPPGLCADPIYVGASVHALDSSVLLVDKRRARPFVDELYRLHELARHELYATFHGDKDVFSLACHLASWRVLQRPANSSFKHCGVSPIAAGEFGVLDDRGCVRGNLVQFLPDNPGVVVHCNCKPKSANYTHVSAAVRWKDVAASSAYRERAEGTDCAWLSGGWPGVADTPPKRIASSKCVWSDTKQCSHPEVMAPVALSWAQADRGKASVALGNKLRGRIPEVASPTT